MLTVKKLEIKKSFSRLTLSNGVQISKKGSRFDFYGCGSVHTGYLRFDGTWQFSYGEPPADVKEIAGNRANWQKATATV